MNAIFRMSAEHGADIGAVAERLKKEANVPVWAVGTSMGTFSAAEAAIAAKNIDGLVLSSTITRSKRQWRIAQSHRDGVASMALSRVKVPTLILSHKNDGCDITPPGDASKLTGKLSAARKVETVVLDGGSKPQSEPCEAKAQHGFWGIEDKAVNAIASFVKANGS
jgi:pimeloyl-ACP methyl ester carboxylesterase